MDFTGARFGGFSRAKGFLGGLPENFPTVFQEAGSAKPGVSPSRLLRKLMLSR
jgi:hypothetical protein